MHWRKSSLPITSKITMLLLLLRLRDFHQWVICPILSEVELNTRATSDSFSIPMHSEKAFMISESLIWFIILSISGSCARHSSINKSNKLLSEYTNLSKPHLWNGLIFWLKGLSSFFEILWPSIQDKIRNLEIELSVWCLFRFLEYRTALCLKIHQYFHAQLLC